MNKKVIALLLIAFTAFASFGCQKKEETTTSLTTTELTTTTQQTTTTTESIVEETFSALYDPSIPFAVNPITGVQDMDLSNEGQRSVAVVINNCYSAIPQRGISAADAIYEYETEGGQTRLLALFADVNTVPEVGSLRSARIVAAHLAAGTNSIFIHYGRNARVPDQLAIWNIDHIDGNNCSAGANNSQSAENGYVELNDGLFFWRDSTWLSQRALEHTAVSDGAHISEGIDYFSINREGETPMLFNFVPEAAAELEADGIATPSFNVFFSQTNDDAFFIYNETDGLYYKSQYDMMQKDETTGEQLAFTNVLILYSDIHSHGDTTVDVELTSGGNGWYVSNGKRIYITWNKFDPNSPIELHPFGFPEDIIEVNRGRSYICIVDEDYESNTTFN